MERLKVTADLREAGKKGVTRRLRKEGAIPAILYGCNEKPVTLAVNCKTFTSMMKGSAGTNVLIELDFKGRETKEPLVVMLKDYQTDMIRHAFTHIDLLKIDLKQKIAVKIPIHVVGKSIGLTKGGLVELVSREIEVKCLPGNIPAQIDVDITELDIGHSFHMKDLALPEGIEAAESGDLTVVSVVAPREEEVAPVAAVVAEAGAVPVAGEAAAAPAGGDTAQKADAKKADVKAEKKPEKK